MSKIAIGTVAGYARRSTPVDRGHLHRLGDVLELDGPLLAGEGLARRLERRRAGQDLVGAGDAADARGLVDPETRVVEAAPAGDRGVHADPDLGRVALGLPVLGEPTLDGDRAIDRIARARERDEEPVALMTDLLPA